MRRKHVWKKNLGMLGQLLSVSILHTSVWLPISVVVLTTATSQTPSDLIIQLQSSFVLLNIVYLSVLGNPIVCVFALPEIKQKIVLLMNSIRQRCGLYVAENGRLNTIYPLTINRIVTT